MLKKIFSNLSIYFALTILIANNIINTGKNQLIVNILAAICLSLIIISIILKYRADNNTKEVNKKQ